MTQANPQADPLTFLDADAEPHLINKQTVLFRAVSLETLFELRVIATPLTKAVAVLFAPTSSDTGQVHRDIAADPEALGIIKEQLTSMDADERRAAIFIQLANSIRDHETVIDPVDVKLATKRGDDQANAISSIVETITSEATLKVVASIAFDSIKRDLYPDKNYPTLASFQAKLTGPTLFQFVVAIAKVNRDSLGPLASALGGLDLTTMFGMIQSRVTQLGQKVDVKSDLTEVDEIPVPPKVG